MSILTLEIQYWPISLFFHWDWKGTKNCYYQTQLLDELNFGGNENNKAPSVSNWDCKPDVQLQFWYFLNTV